MILDAFSFCDKTHVEEVIGGQPEEEKHFCIPKFFPFNVLTSLPGTYVTNIEIKTKSIEKADKHSTDNKYIWQEYIFMFWITNKNEIRDNVFIYLSE